MEISPRVARDPRRLYGSSSRLPAPRSPQRAVSAASACCDSLARRASARTCASRRSCDSRTALLSTIEDVDGLLFGGLIFVDADDDFLAGIDACLASRRRLFDAHLGNAGLDGLGHSAQRFDLLDVLPRLVHQVVGQRLDIVAARPRVDYFGDAGLFLQVDLRVAGDARRKIRGQRDGFVERVGVQRLRVAQNGGQRFHAGARHVIEDVLRGEAPARGLAMRAQRHAISGSSGGSP